MRHISIYKYKNGAKDNTCSSEYEICYDENGKISDVSCYLGDCSEYFIKKEVDTNYMIEYLDSNLQTKRVEYLKNGEQIAELEFV